jgi:hypothetical protein
MSAMHEKGTRGGPVSRGCSLRAEAGTPAGDRAVPFAAPLGGAPPVDRQDQKPGVTGRSCRASGRPVAGIRGGADLRAAFARPYRPASARIFLKPSSEIFTHSMELFPSG